MNNLCRQEQHEFNYIDAPAVYYQASFDVVIKYIEWRTTLFLCIFKCTLKNSVHFFVFGII